MPNKCCVTGCYTNFNEGPKKTVFKFPGDPALSKKCLEFVNRIGFENSQYSVICIDHFEEKFIFKHETKMTLNYSMRPIPTIHPSFIPSSLAPIPSESRKVPKLRIYQPDELQSFKSKFEIGSFGEVVRYIKTSKEYNNFQVDVSDNSVTAYRVEISFGIASVKECIHVDSNLNIKLRYEGSPIPLPSYIAQAQGTRLASLDMLTNLPRVL